MGNDVLCEPFLKRGLPPVDRSYNKVTSHSPLSAFW